MQFPTQSWLKYTKILGLSVSLIATSNLVFATGIKDQPQRLIIKFSENDSLEKGKLKNDVARATGQAIAAERKMAAKKHRLLTLEKRLSKSQLDKVMKRIKNMPGVELVEEDVFIQTAATANDSRYNEQWHYFNAQTGINVEPVWDTYSGKGVTVAVIDTGITRHTDLDANIIMGYDFISSAKIANDGNGRDADPSDEGDWLEINECSDTYPTSTKNSSWHGTHVAGTIAAVTNNGTGVAGAAPGAKVLVLRALGKCGGYMSDVSDAVIWASGGSVSGVPENTNPAKVVNLSLSSTALCASYMQDAINKAVANGTTVVAAAGNNNKSASNYMPANCNNVVTVASNDREGNKAWYSNFGTAVDVAAPGGEGSSSGVLSTVDSGSRAPSGPTYAYKQGTSMATPHVAAVIALMYEANPYLTPAEVEKQLKATAKAMPGACTEGCGAGIVDAPAAVAAVANNSVENVAPKAVFTVSKSDLSVRFHDASSDDDGQINKWSWNFGDDNTSTAQNPQHNYAEAGSYTVSLTVTDNLGASDRQTTTVTVSAPVVEEPVTEEPVTEPVPTQNISLSVYQSGKGKRKQIQLNWSGATSEFVDVYLNGSVIASTANDGNYVTNGVRGKKVYKVCEAGKNICSPNVQL